MWIVLLLWLDLITDACRLFWLAYLQLVEVFNHLIELVKTQVGICDEIVQHQLDSIGKVSFKDIMHYVRWEATGAYMVEVEGVQK